MITHRAAFTMIELLLVITVIAVLAGLLLAGISTVRGSAYSTMCLNNQRQIGLSLAAYSVDFRGLIPPTELEDFEGRNTTAHWGKWFGFIEGYIPDFANSPVFMCPTWVRRSDLPKTRRSDLTKEQNDYWELHNLYSISYGYPSYIQKNVLNRTTWRWRFDVGLPAEMTALLAERWGVNSSGGYDSTPNVWPNWEKTAQVGERPAPATNANANETSQRFSHKKRSNVLFYDLHVAALTVDQVGMTQTDSPNIWYGR